MIEILFWIALALIFYAFVGYGIIIIFLSLLNRERKYSFGQRQLYPALTLIVTCCNERDYILNKIENSLQLVYPKKRLQIIFISDGSDDGTDQLIANHNAVVAIHCAERRGKMVAMSRAVSVATGDILVFSDANTILNRDALMFIAARYQDPKVGAVAGKKRFLLSDSSADAETREGFYWRYEFALKKWDAAFYTMVGAEGELFSCRKNLYEELPSDTILNDFMLSMRIAEKGFRVVYEPGATATEIVTLNAEDEMNHRLCVAEGGWQSMSRLKKAINPFHNFKLWFQYVSHRVLRWSVTPFLLLFVLVINHFLWDAAPLYQWLLVGQYVFYSFALIGLVLEQRRIKFKPFFIPYYFVVINYCALAGFFRFVKGQKN